jgi:glycosyltransferase involved in cell wall biosynthesis
MDIVDAMRGSGSDVFHMQYPATGYGRKLAPQLVSMTTPLVVTIHECSQTHILRKLSLYPFSIRAREIIFTNEFERQYARRFAPWIDKRSRVIPIGNNIPLGRVVEKDRARTVTYFGLIRPQKGIEEVLEMARIFKNRDIGLGARIIGTVLPGHEEYYARLKTEALDLPVEWVIGLNGEPLSQALAETEIAYLPFPDGASERRSSLIAMLANKAAIITTSGPHTPSSMRDAVLLAKSSQHAAELAEEMYHTPAMHRALQSKASGYSARYAWDSIAGEHIAMYQRLMSGK